VQFTASETTGYLLLGLSHTDTNQSYNTIDYAIYLQPNGNVSGYEGATHLGNLGSYGTGDVLRVAIENGVVMFKKNGDVFYTSTAAPNYPLMVDTSLYTNGATINNVVLSGASGGGSSSAQIHWLVTDQLGTPRMVFDQTGSLANVSRHDYLPFGEEIYAGTGGRTAPQGYTLSDNVRQKFTSKERDNETGLDFFEARYYRSIQGRFTSVDPSKVSIQLGNPQSWNRYSYAYNNPLTLVDENGKWPTSIHNLVVDNALRGLPAAERKQIKDGSWSVDDPRFGGQDVAQSNQHGMTKPGQSQEEAADNAGQFINDNVEQAQDLRRRNDMYSVWPSLYYFGRAFHTVSDMTSPAHEGYQRWDGGLFHPYNTGRHIGSEWSISNFRMGLAVGATLALYRYTYGHQALQRATGYTPGSENDPTLKDIRAQFSRPGSRAVAEAQAVHEYRLGLQEGLNFDFSRQRGRRRRRDKDPE
jgi:RHS repeat-associated protein